MGQSTTPPKPDGAPLLGHALEFSRDSFGALQRWAKRGDIVHLEFPGETFYLVSDPAIVEAVLHDGDGRFTVADQQQRAFADIEDHAVTTATGDRWRRLRRALQPAFTRDTIDRYADAIVERTARRVETWDDGEELDLHREMRLLTLDVLAETLLSVDIRGDEDVVLNATDALVDRSDPRRPGQLVPDWVPTPTDRRFRRAVRELDDYVDRCLEARRGTDPGNRDGHEDRDGNGTDGYGTDACSVLLAAHDRGDLSMAEVRHNLVALLLAGSDTSALGLTYCWHLLSDHPDVRESLVEEYDDHADGGRPDRRVLEQLDVHRNVVAETLRLYPPTWNTMRKATRPVTLGGYRLPAGSELLLSQWVLHRDERFWESPAAFRPSRWERDDAERPQYAYFPFSGGPRHCIGMHFARLELHLALATMVGRVALEVSVEDSLTFSPTISLRPETEITATIRRR